MGALASYRGAYGAYWCPCGKSYQDGACFRAHLEACQGVTLPKRERRRRAQDAGAVPSEQLWACPHCGRTWLPWSKVYREHVAGCRGPVKPAEGSEAAYLAELAEQVRRSMGMS